MSVRLAPYCSVLPRGPRARQLGLDPARCAVVEGLSPPLALLLDELTAPVEPGELAARAVRRGAAAAQVEAVLELLVGAGVLVDAAAEGHRAARRAGSTVLVDGDGPLAAGVVTGLLREGVGTVHARTGGTVVAADVGTGFLDADRGHHRADALAAAADRVRPGAGVGPPPRRVEPDLVVLTDAQAPDPVVVLGLLAAGTPHLPVRVRDGAGVVGPLVLPGRSACLGCLDLHRTARDPGWPVVAAQLVERPGRAGPAAVAATAALGTAQALAALDGAGAPVALDATIELDVTAATALRRPWSPHPECPCGAAPARGGSRHPRATCASPRAGGTITA